MRLKVKLVGFKELDDALGQLPKATGKNVLRRTLKAAGEPMAAAGASNARRSSGRLSESYAVSPKLVGSQRPKHNKRSTVETFVGPGPLTQSITEEFGTFQQAPSPHLRPAWDAEKMDTLDRIKESLASEIAKAVSRIAKKAAKRAKAMS